MHDHNKPTEELVKEVIDAVNEELHQRLMGIGVAVTDRLREAVPSLMENIDTAVIEKYLESILGGYSDPFDMLYSYSGMEEAIEEADPFLNERTCDNCLGARADIRWNDGKRESVFLSFIDKSEDISAEADEAIFYYMEDRNDLYVGFSNGEWTIVG